MDKPKRLVLDDGSYFNMARMGVLGGIGMMAVVTAIVLTQTDATLADLALPFAALTLLWLPWVAVNIIVGLVHRFNTKRDIGRLFEQEIWQYWQLGSDEWRDVVESEHETMLPESGASAYVGGVYSTIVGLVIGAILVIVGKFVIKDEQAMPIILICAAAVVVLLAGLGLFQPIRERGKALRYRRQALRVLEPRVWFGAEGVYHETLGYTSLKELKKVTDQTKTRQSIKFTIEVTTGGGDEPMATFRQPVSFSVPSGYEQQAGRLVRRYRQERLRD